MHSACHGAMLIADVCGCWQMLVGLVSPTLNFMLKMALFSLVLATTHFEEWKGTDTLSELDNILQKVARDKSLVQNPPFANRILNKTFDQILFNFFHFFDEKFQFCFCRRIWTPVQNIDFCHFKFEFKFKMTDFSISQLLPWKCLNLKASTPTCSHFQASSTFLKNPI